ncbi:MAG: integration host factor subunit beta [Sedimentisphaerales bacterium]|nr:integration host factor subunit beta [Sedimentisphaerales bacterium]
MATITKKDLVDRVAIITGEKRLLTKDILQQFLNDIVAELARGNRIEFRDFGIFEVKERSARTAQNPKTLKKVRVPAKRTVKFRGGRLMKEKLNGQVQN